MDFSPKLPTEENKLGALSKTIIIIIIIRTLFIEGDT